MKILYFNKKTEEYFSDFEKIRRIIGTEMAIILKRRINELKAADTFEIFLKSGLGKPHSLKGDLKGGYGIRLTSNFRLVAFPEAPDLSPAALRACGAVKIRGVIDYHGEKNNRFVIP